MFTWSSGTAATDQAFPSHLITGYGPPPAPPVHNATRTEVHSIFDRLKWLILGTPSQAELFSLNTEVEPQWTMLFSDPVVDEAATVPPLSRLRISIETIVGWEYWQQTDKDPPEAALIENKDGQPVSIRQFMQALYNYAVPLRKLLCRCCDI